MEHNQNAQNNENSVQPSLRQETGFLKLMKQLNSVLILCIIDFCFVPIYIFSFHHEQCTSDQKDFTFVKYTSQMLSSADESLKKKKACYCSEWFVRDTAHIVFIRLISVVNPVHIFISRNRVSKIFSMAGVCFHCFFHFGCVPIHIFRFHHKYCAWG